MSVQVSRCGMYQTPSSDVNIIQATSPPSHLQNLIIISLEIVPCHAITRQSGVCCQCGDRRYHDVCWPRLVMSEWLHCLPRRRKEAVTASALHPALPRLQQMRLSLPTSHLTLPTSHLTLPTSHLSLPTSHLTLPTSHLSLPTSNLTLSSSYLTLPNSHLTLSSSYLTLLNSHLTLPT